MKTQFQLFLIFIKDRLDILGISKFQCRNIFIVINIIQLCLGNLALLTVNQGKGKSAESSYFDLLRNGGLHPVKFTHSEFQKTISNCSLISGFNIFFLATVSPYSSKMKEYRCCLYYSFFYKDVIFPHRVVTNFINRNIYFVTFLLSTTRKTFSPGFTIWNRSRAIFFT